MSPIFDSDSLTKAISELSDSGLIPSHHDKVFVIAATKDGVKGILSVKVNDIWQVDALVSTNYHGDLSGGLLIKGSWK